MRATLSRGPALGVVASAALLGVHQSAASAATDDQPATPTAVEVFTADPDENAEQLSPEPGEALERAESRAEADAANLAPPYVTSAGNLIVPVRAGADSSREAYAAGMIMIEPNTALDASAPGPGAAPSMATAPRRVTRVVGSSRSRPTEIVAKSIHSGGGGGGSDHYTGALEPPCREYYTDIRVAERVLPDIVKKA